MKPFSRILVANRGEIAQRVIRACKELGIESVAVYSEADRNASYLDLADHKVCIGPPPSLNSYLDISKIIAAAEITDVEAIHPGYGFLSENPQFAEICQSCRIQFIGPTVENIRQLGDKAMAREIAMKSGVPVVPGSPEIVPDEDQGLEVARQIGFPVLIKAVAGGGGRGMRIAREESSFVAAYQAARAEAGNAFKNSDVYIEKLIEKPRHVEIQILADSYGSVIHLGERDCSLQRRHQKLVEESPSPAVDDALRARMGESAVNLARASEYRGAGTVEFLLDREGNYYFIEMNTRIQVEHPVTEMVTGVDLVQEQIRIASGEPLRYQQEDIKIKGHAMECRINAEDPSRGFAPSPGKILEFRAPGGMGVRLDSHVYSGYTVPSNYDSLLGKLIVHRDTREEAILTMRRALEEFKIEGINTTIPFYSEVLQHFHFVKGNLDTGFIEEYLIDA
ncbi:MAG: acetyl-CoA carboxylase biotin carboxylase subunit [Planctomycetia bacterium]|jgi:acetyl-CoA carboxylase, biotin carboxylase subunit|nr:acetyl-CoA carboxylase biotin carboxylase subunit [Planctomycetia bacterium]NCF98925.1 acetyl-CoA carboxylase biotin carboxylase subunit [Planctomycetia bacterium]NCG12622.1 acetyl-CoA carboxylase biotin carboxylase subunit [Planctomycetia bacterium]NCG56530.1 acetyl-CoA carboxylase biotin carboxylase subunit [Pseudomonadota bacterium]